MKTLFREQNLGCKIAVSNAIDWFFDNEEAGIILEDDCLPAQSFFWFCDELLEKYKDDLRIWHIGGNNFGAKIANKRQDSYVFVRYPQVWGWATWRSRWKFYDKDLLDFKHSFECNECISSTLNLININILSMKERFTKSTNGLIDTWDYQWHATVIKNHGLCIVPLKNLISNIGDGPDATHTVNDRERTHLKIEQVGLPLKSPNSFFINHQMEEHFKDKMRIAAKKAPLDPPSNNIEIKLPFKDYYITIQKRNH